MLLVHTSLGLGLGMAAEQETWPAMLSPSQHPEGLKMLPRCGVTAGHHCAFRRAVVWCLVRWSQHLPCTAELEVSYTFFSFPYPYVARDILRCTHQSPMIALLSGIGVIVFCWL